MQNITNKLNNRAELWGMIPFENELGEMDTKEGIIKSLIYCNILPKGAMKTITPVTEGMEFSHKFTVRTKSLIPELDMFFMFKGQKHEFRSWEPDYKNNEFLEVFTKLVIE